jgi:hypothetical protein
MTHWQTMGMAPLWHSEGDSSRSVLMREGSYTVQLVLVRCEPALATAHRRLHASISKQKGCTQKCGVYLASSMFCGGTC